MEREIRNLHSPKDRAVFHHLMASNYLCLKNIPEARKQYQLGLIEAPGDAALVLSYARFLVFYTEEFAECAVVLSSVLERGKLATRLKEYQLRALFGAVAQILDLPDKDAILLAAFQNPKPIKKHCDLTALELMAAEGVKLSAGVASKISDLLETLNNVPMSIRTYLEASA